MKRTGDDYYDSEEFHDLLDTYEEAVNNGEPVFMDADELAEIADFYQMTGNPDAADRAINLALSLSPGAIAPLSYKIHEALIDGEIDAAKEYLSQIVERDEPDYIYDKAEILIAEDKIEEADQYLRSQLKDLPPEEYQDYVVDIANIYADYGLSEKTMEWIARAKPEDTQDFKELMARTFFGLGKFKESERLFNELIDANPFSKRYWNDLASAQFMNEDYSGAIQSSEFAIAIDPEDPEGIVAKANGLFRLNNYEEALSYYQRYSEMEPDDELALLNAGSCLINLGRFKEAEEVLRLAEEKTPEDSAYLCDVYQELAFALSEDGQTEEALRYMNKTDELDCDHVQMKVIKGHILVAAGRMKEAGNHFGQALKESDNSPRTLMRIIVSFYDNRFIEGAYKLFRMFFRNVPDDFDEGYAYMALCCYDLKKYDEFLDYLKTACERNPKECRQVLSHLFPEDLTPEKYYDYIKDRIK